MMDLYIVDILRALAVHDSNQNKPTQTDPDRN